MISTKLKHLTKKQGLFVKKKVFKMQFGIDYSGQIDINPLFFYTLELIIASFYFLSMDLVG